MHKTRSALLAGAVCAALSAVTTFLLWQLPRLAAAHVSAEPGIAPAHPLLLAQLGVNLGHVFLALAGYAAAARLAAERSPALAWAGLVAFGAWTFAEALGVSINLWAVNATWKSAYATSGPEEQAALKSAMLTAAGIWDGVFFLVLVAFLAGSLFLGLAMTAQPGLGRAVAVLVLLAVPLTFAILLDGYFGARLSSWIGWSYPLLQPLSRGVMAVWIWREAAALHDTRQGAG